jgi:5'-AMP-activated protein kinase catalytic alpha subunit
MSHSPTSGASHVADMHSRMAEEAARALMQAGPRLSVGSGGQSKLSGSMGSQPINPPPVSISGMVTGVGSGPSTVQMQSSIPGNIGMISQFQHGRRSRRWYLGIQSKKDPAHVMTEVYKALHALGCEWLQLSSYRIKCRWRPNRPRFIDDQVDPRKYHTVQTDDSVEMAHNQYNPKQHPRDSSWHRNHQNHVQKQDMQMDIQMNDAVMSQECRMRVITGDSWNYGSIPNLNTPEYCITIGLTLYKVQQNIYLLDFQKIAGDPFSFMTLCANIITELKTLSAASKQALIAIVQQQGALQPSVDGVNVSGNTTSFK